VLKRAGYRCEHVDAHGARCTVTDPARLQAHHLRDLVDGGSNDPATNGRCYCRAHHRLIERAWVL
jgi:predicted restriction endonuclease